MIIGIGTDLCDIRRIAKTIDRHGERFLDRIFSEARRCSKIVQSLLSFARQHAPERKRINLNESVNAALEILRDEGVVRRLYAELQREV